VNVDADRFFTVEEECLVGLHIEVPEGAPGICDAIDCTGPATKLCYGAALCSPCFDRLYGIDGLDIEPGDLAIRPGRARSPRRRVPAGDSGPARRR